MGNQSKQEQKQKRIRAILDTCGKQLEGEGVAYFLGAVDKSPEEADGGKAYSQAEISGEDMVHIIDIAFPSVQDIRNLGIWVGLVIQGRIAIEAKKKKPAQPAKSALKISKK